MQELKIVSKDRVRNGEEPVTVIVEKLTDVITYTEGYGKPLVIVVGKLGGSDVFYLYEDSQLVRKEEKPQVESDVSYATEEGDHEEKVTTQEVPKQIKYIKPTPEKILPNIRCRCVTGSNAGLMGKVVSVTRPGAPDCETIRISQQNTGEMTLSPLFPVPDNVRIMFENPKEGDTTESIRGVKRNITGKNVGVTLTKKQFCDNWKIIVGE